MFIIFTGCDRSGKTTLARAYYNYQLKRNSNIEYIHFIAPKTQSEAKEKYFNFINTANLNKLYILDRFYESEYVYAPIYRNYHIDYLEEIEQLLSQKQKALFIYVRTPLQVIQNRLEHIGDDYINIKDINIICSNYEQFFDMTSIPFITINGDYPLNNQLQILERIDSDINLFS